MMMKKVILFFCVAVLFAACGNDSEPMGEVKPVTEGPSGKPGKSMEDLRANAIKETDLIGRAQAGLRVLQEEYGKSEGKVPGIGKVTIFMDEHFTVLIKNEVGQDLFETKFNLKNLNPESDGLSIIPNKAPGEFPGLRIAVLDGKPKVEISKNGKTTSREDNLTIFLAERSNIERITPALLQTLYVVHGKN